MIMSGLAFGRFGGTCDRLFWASTGPSCINPDAARLGPNWSPYMEGMILTCLNTWHNCCCWLAGWQVGILHAARLFPPRCPLGTLKHPTARPNPDRQSCPSVEQGRTSGSRSSVKRIMWRVVLGCMVHLMYCSWGPWQGWG